MAHLPNAATISPRSDNVLVGREAEIRQLLAGLDEALGGGTRLFLITGEPGVGKTSLAENLARHAAGRGVRVVWGRAWEEGGAPPLWPWVAVTRGCLPPVDRLSGVSPPGKAAAPIEMLTSDIIELPTTAVHSAAPSSAGTVHSSANLEEAELARFELFDSVARLLEDASSVQPLLIVLDDFHAADESSLLLMQFVARNVRGARIMLVAIYRDVEARLSRRCAELLERVSREGHRIVLHGLSEEGVREFLEAKTAMPAGQGLVTALHQVTEGNPLFLREVVRLIISEGRVEDLGTLDLATLGVPHGVRETVRRRLDFLSPAANDLLELASVIGREFDFEVIRRLSGLAPDTLLDSLHETIVCDLVGQAASTFGRYHFSHALIRETIYDQLAKSRRSSFHNRIAQTLEELYGTGADAPISELAYHYAQALPVGNADKALDYALRAARHAVGLVSYDEAARLFEMALLVLASKVPSDRERRLEVMLELGEAQYLSGDYVHSKSTFEQAARLAGELGKPDQLARAALGRGLVTTDYGMVDMTVVGLLREALRAIGEQHVATRALLLARWAEELRWSDAAAERDSLSRQAVEMARYVGDPRILLRALYGRQYAIWGPDDLQERLAVGFETGRLAEQCGDKLMALRVRYQWMNALLEAAEIETLDREIRACVDLAEALKQKIGRPEDVLAMRAIMAGRFDEGERLALRSLQLGQGRGWAVPFQIYTALMFFVRREQGRLGEMEQTLQTLVDRFPSLVQARCLLCVCYLEIEREADARVEFEHLAVDDFRAIHRDVNWFASLVSLSEVCAALGDAARANLLYTLLLPYASRNACNGPQLYHGPISHYLGLLATAIGRFEHAETHFEAALQRHLRMGTRPWMSRTQCEYGRMLIARDRPGDLPRARALLQSAVTTAAGFGMARVAQRAFLLQTQMEQQTLSLGTGRSLVSGGSPPESGAEKTASRRSVASILFIDIVESTARVAQITDSRWVELRGRFFDAMRRELETFGGREIGTAGDEMVAVFDQPTAAINSAHAMTRRAAALDLQVRCGIHTGECDFVGSDIVGIAVHLCARVASCARPNEVLVSSTVRDLLSGSEIQFIDRGMHALKGIPEQWRLYAVQSRY
jgi:eukaryotic-like serine/threonine-protein kinase